MHSSREHSFALPRTVACPREDRRLSSRGRMLVLVSNKRSAPSKMQTVHADDMFQRVYLIFCQYSVWPMPMIVARSFSFLALSNLAVAFTLIPFVGS